MLIRTPYRLVNIEHKTMNQRGHDYLSSLLPEGLQPMVEPCTSEMQVCHQVIAADNSDAVVWCLRCTCRVRAGFQVSYVRARGFTYLVEVVCQSCHRKAVLFERMYALRQQAHDTQTYRCEQCREERFVLAIGIEFAPDVVDWFYEESGGNIISSDFQDKPVSWLWLAGLCHRCRRAYLIESLETD